MITDVLSGFDHQRATNDLQYELIKEIGELTELVLETAKSNIRYYPSVRNYLQKQLLVVANQMVSGVITADYWQAWLEQFGKGSLMAGERDNPGLRDYMNSEAWNTLRSRNSKVIVGRRVGRYKSIDGTVRFSRGGYAGVDLEELAQRGDIDRKFLPTPPTFFMRVALQSNKRRILEGISRVIETFPYHRYFVTR